MHWEIRLAFTNFKGSQRVQLYWRTARYTYKTLYLFKKTAVVCACLVLLPFMIIGYRLGLVPEVSPQVVDGQYADLVVPEMVHIALTDDPSQMSVVWASESFRDWDLLYGRSDEKLEGRALLLAATLTVNNNYGTTYWYRALLTDLTADTEYNYTIVSLTDANNHRMFSFHTLQAKRSWPTRLMLFGDLGLASRIIKDVIKHGGSGYNAVFHVGDIGQALDSDDGLVGDSFLWRMEPLISRVAYMVIPGDNDSSDRYAHYRYRFSVPGVPWPMPPERTWYSVDIGMLHMVAINTGVNRTESPDVAGDQIRWLERDLRRANERRRLVPWIVVLGHYPFYTSSRQGSVSADLATMEYLFNRHGVDLVVQSHAHMYERTWPVYLGRSNATSYTHRKAPVYVTVGSPGYKYGSEHVDGRPANWSAVLFANSTESFGRLTVLGARRLLWEQVAPLADEHILDEFMLE